MQGVRNQFVTGIFISTLHIWWARRPLAACRAVICAALWPDPADPLCPQEFREKAANIITEFAKKAVSDKDLAAHSSTDIWNKWQVLAKPENKLDPNNSSHLNILRFRLLDFIADFANWDNSTQPDYLATSRALTQAAHEALGGIPGTKPLVVDPFAGGGAIPLEALRVGADAFASDLNPVAVLLNKVVLEYIPKYGQQLADEVRKWGQWVKEQAEKELAEFYPKDPDGAKPIAYLWARTITCEGPGCGAEVPLMRSLWLAKKSNRSVALRIVPSPPASFTLTPSPSPRGRGELGEGRWDGEGKQGLQTEISAIAGLKRQIPDVLLQRARELRKQQTPAENILWECLRNRQLLGAKFRRQHNIGQFIADFYCHEARLIVEADGGIHETRQESDQIRDEWVRDNGFTVLRFKNEEILNATEQVLNTIAEALLPSSSSPLPEGEGLGVRAKKAGNESKPRIEFQIIENAKAKDVGDGTVHRGSATCPCCGFTTPVASVRRQLKERRGGAADARLFCVVTTKPGLQGRFYRLPTEQDLEAVGKAETELEKRKREHKGALSLVPDEPTPTNDGHRAVGSVFIYGMEKWGYLFTPRQALALTTLARQVREAGEKLAAENENGLAFAVQTCLALAIDRQADKLSSLGRWDISRENPQGSFARQALPIVWDFSEVNPLSGSGGDWHTALTWVLQVVEEVITSENLGQSEQASATTHPLPDDSAQFFCTDPPYYDSVPYADVADFFYVWLKRTLANCHKDLFQASLTPKLEQIIVWHPNSVEERNQFEKKMSQAMSEGRRVLAPDGIGVVVFAHKSTSGWEAQLQAMIDAGWTVTGSWPIDTELGNRMNAMGTASLASSIHLVCRPRNNPNDIGDWRDVLQELPKRIHEWMPRLASEGVVGADAIFACLGPALEIFSRYSRVEKASGEQVTLKEYLEYVWAGVSKEALNMIFEGADATGFEEDARLTAMWLWTLSTDAATNGGNSTSPLPVGEGLGVRDEIEDEDDEETSSKAGKVSGFVLEFDAARKIAQGLGAHLENLTRLVEVKGDKARLLPVSERTQYLFGKDEGKAPAKRKKKDAQQLTLFDIPGSAEDDSTDWGDKSVPQLGNTVLDRIHQSMILFAAGRSEALKRFLVEDGVGQDQRLWRLAQALSALYPTGTDEKRWVDGVLARKKGLGF